VGQAIETRRCDCRAGLRCSDRPITLRHDDLKRLQLTIPSYQAQQFIARKDSIGKERESPETDKELICLLQQSNR
jgi:hypothetical protein